MVVGSSGVATARSSDGLTCTCTRNRGTQCELRHYTGGVGGVGGAYPRSRGMKTSISSPYLPNKSVRSRSSVWLQRAAPACAQQTGDRSCTDRRPRATCCECRHPRGTGGHAGVWLRRPPSPPLERKGARSSTSGDGKQDRLALEQGRVDRAIWVISQREAQPAFGISGRVGEQGARALSSSSSKS